MTTARRQRKWLNEQNTIAVGSGNQDSRTIATIGFDKGETVVRILLSVSVRLFTEAVPVVIGVGVWVGQFGGIPTDIFADSPESYMMWDGWEQEGGAAGGVTQVRRTYDLRGQRQSRSDSENIHFIVKNSGGAGTVTTTLFSRCLVLLP